ncbi:hypothetical protein C1A50_4655 [Paenibacillus polymyxa]|nr:hypothetical protein C1A50_4655 [Paenibacillus polymyxa]
MKIFRQPSHGKGAGCVSNLSHHRTVTNNISYYIEYFCLLQAKTKKTMYLIFKDNNCARSSRISSREKPPHHGRGSFCFVPIQCYSFQYNVAIFKARSLII